MEKSSKWSDRTWPDGTPFTIATYAAEMISISDNTAADVLVRLAGPKALAPYAMRDTPFLTTREAFILKSKPGVGQRTAYRAARTSAERIAIFRTVDKMPLPAIDELAAHADLGIEWLTTFENSADTCAARQTFRLCRSTLTPPTLGLRKGYVPPKSAELLVGASSNGLYSAVASEALNNGVPKGVNVRVVTFLACVLSSLSAKATLASGAQWQPPDIHPTTATLADVLAIRAQASRPSQQAAQRHERWTYVNGTRRIAVTVAVRGDDFRTSLDLDGLTYLAGRLGGARWRGDGNGIIHGVQADLQGDALDRAPQAVFPLDSAALTLVGETEPPAPTWVLEADRSGDKPAFLYVEKATGNIVREVMRDGKRVVTTAFDRFDANDGALRPHRWRVDDGSVDDRLDVTVDAVEPGAVPVADVAFPERRIFASATAVPGSPLPASVDLPASFHGGSILIAVDIGEAREHFVLDTGTTSVTVDPRIARRYGGATLEHAVLPKMSIGALQLERVSVLTVPFGGGGILGLDFFFGHVVEIDYRHERVRVLSAADARAVFADPQMSVVAANVDQGLPLVTAAFGPAGGDTFAIDTGSPRLYVMRPFATRFADEIASHWTPAGAPYVERYLEGGIEVRPYRVAEFALAKARAHDIIVGAQLPTTRTDDLAIPFDGIIGTEILRNFDLYFDYDNGRLGLRQ